MEICTDSKDQLYIQWQQCVDGMPETMKRAWIQYRDGERDWAGTGRYLNVVRCGADGNPRGNATDFPIYSSDLSDVQILSAFVAAVNAITGCNDTWSLER